MTVFRRKGDELRGDKLFYKFGSSPEGRTDGTRAKRGTVEVVKPLTQGKGGSQHGDMLDCEIAKFSCSKHERRKKCVITGNHRGYSGRLGGVAWARSHQPHLFFPCAQS